MPFIIAIDQSTSATKALLFDDQARMRDRVDKNHQQFYPEPGWVEHDPVEIYSNVVVLINQLIQKHHVNEKDIQALAITNQRETVVLWDKQTGMPVYNAIVWQCQRGAAYCKELIQQGRQAFIKERTGLIIDPYFSASCVKWVMENVDGVKEKAQAGDIAMGTMDAWLIYNLTRGAVHATDHSNASRTMLYNIYKKQWDQQILDMMDIPAVILPEVRSSNSVFGHVKDGDVFTSPIPICGVMGDSHAALFGQMCFEPGQGKSSFGTGSSVMINIGSEQVQAPQGLVTSIGYSVGNQVNYVFEGNIHSTGDTIQWLVDNLGLIAHGKETENIALSVENSRGVYFVPAFAGLGAPYWNNEARAAIVGMDRGANKAHIVRAALESIAYQVKDVIDAVQQHASSTIQSLKVDGGPTNNTFLMQFMADMLNISVIRSSIEEAPTLGVALMAGHAQKLWDVHQLKLEENSGMSYYPSMDETQRKELYTGWQHAVQRVLK